MKGFRSNLLCDDPRLSRYQLSTVWSVGIGQCKFDVIFFCVLADPSNIILSVLDVIRELENEHPWIMI